MRNKIIFIITVVVVCVAVYGIFNLVFPEPSTLMGWCVASGIVMTAILASNVLIVSHHNKLTIKNAATTWALNLSGILFFVWTLIFIFGFGSYQDNERSLNGLYIGYLIILVIGIAIWLLADSGGSLAQAHSKSIQTSIQSRDQLVSQLKQLKLALEVVDKDTRSPLHIAFSQNIEMMRNIPTSIISNPNVSQQLSSSIINLSQSIDSGEIATIEDNNNHLSFIIKSFRI